ncbi:carbohydate-binding domain-containing protein [Archangium violaceum]|uniref:family 20 glycosylhydrolase n=1 Tax=Archangium violaceum TaxID=83451 RepID=UPI0019500C62|nr:family 20 glycosylhydrolase [Archangium violaceum]QRO01780.1 carbohydate-binding domain-containing protein [Archangium violaceum]
MKRFLISLPVMAVLASGCQEPGDKNPDTGDSTPQLPAELTVQWQPIDNSVGSWKFFRSEFTLENRGPRELGSSGWKLYFSIIRRPLNEGEGDDTGIQNLTAQGLKLSKGDAAGSGDYLVLEPLPSFKPIAAGEKRVISVLFQDWAIMKTDAPAGFHITFQGDGFDPKVAFAVPSTVKIDPADPKQTTRWEGDVLPVQTPALRHDENPSLQNLELSARLLPSPRRIETGTGQVTLRGGTVIGYPSDLKNEAAYLTAALGDVLAGTVSMQAASGSEQISLSIDANLDIDEDGARDAEGYVLDVKDGKVAIKGADAAGVFYGIQTLRQLVPVEAYAAAAQIANRSTELALPVVHIADAPGFVYRGMALDVARHFQTKETVKKLLDVLSHYKINKFHFRLTDDEGWRLEIPGIPELTSYGARRGFDPAEAEMLHSGLGSMNDLGGDDFVSLKPASQKLANGNEAWPAYQGFETATLNYVGKGNGFYTTKDFEEILAYAAERHIDVIPEVDVPGHARAAVMAMEYRYRKYKDSDPTKATEYRLRDPQDTSKHKSVQEYTDNFLNPCMDSSYAFLTKVANEIKARYDAVPSARLMAIHGGGDELPNPASNVWWTGSPLCKSNPETKDLTDIQLYNRFFTKWSQIIQKTGTKMTGWDDIIHNGLKLDGFIPMPWSNVWGWGREDDAYKFANEGYQVILSHSTNLYMDLAYNKDPDEPGYYWANFVDEKKTFEYRPFDIYANATHDRMGNPLSADAMKDKVRLTEAGRKNILGMHGLLFSENVKTEGILEYLAFPKVLGVAERAWNPELPPVEEMPALWARFTNSLGQYVLPRLGAYRAVDLRDEIPNGVGVNYRIPLPGARILDGKLNANVRFPGLAVEYSTNGGSSWKQYSAPVAVSGKVLLRTRASDGRYSRTAELN